ncbi:MAG: hypothetical protein HP494_02420 [Nitrospira sp.]|nr:hypothetical protein [Nitrospira sp.]
MKTNQTSGVTAPLGFEATGIHCGIKKPGILDLALVVSTVSGPIAGVFTKNQVAAAPVILDRLHLRRRQGRAIIVNSGNANACTGADGLASAQAMASTVAQSLSIPMHQVFVGSTGVIGRVLPIDRIKAGIPALVAHSSTRMASGFVTVTVAACSRQMAASLSSILPVGMAERRRTCGRPTSHTTTSVSTQAIDLKPEFSGSVLKTHRDCDSVPRL